jgi:hypothetical protein
LPDYVEYLKSLVAKAVSAGAAVFISDNGVDALLKFVSAPSPETAVPLKLVSLVVAYAVWTQVIIPAVDEAYKAQTKTTAAASGTWATRSKLF